MLIFLIIAVLFLLINFAPKGHIYKDDFLDDLKMEVHRYSGVHPESFNNFMTNMELMEDNITKTDLASYYLYSAIDNAQNLAMYTTGHGTFVIDEVAEITNRLGTYAEQIIMNEALLRGNSFKPRYLNEKIN